MEINTQTPIVYLACVNSSKKGKRLTYLFNERQMISNILSFGRSKPLFEPVHKDPTSDTYFFPDFIDKDFYQDRVRVLHFSGHAESEHLRIEAGKSEWSIHINELSRVIDLLPNLELVYLNGCATPKLMDMLARRDIPAVMISETRKKDFRSRKVAKTFYSEIAKGASIHQAFMRIQKRFKRFGAFRLKYDVDSDQFQWPFDLNTLEKGKLPWGLYFLEDHESTLYKPLSLDKKEKNKFPLEKWIFPKKNSAKLPASAYTIAAALLALIATGLSLHLGQLPSEELEQLMSLLALK